MNKMLSKMSIAAMVGLCTCSLLLGGCEAVLSVAGTAAYERYAQEDVNLTEKNYAATDYLIQQSNTYYDRFTPIKIMPLNDFERPGLTSRFGRLVGNQVGSRFAQLGYNVDLSEVPLQEDSNDLLAQKDRYNIKSPKILVTGTYRKDSPDMAVTLRVVEAKTGYTITTFEYYVRYDSDIRRMSDPEIRIMQVR